MKELSKQERLFIYEKTLRDENLWSGLCFALNQSMQHIYPDFAYFLEHYYPSRGEKEDDILIPDPYYHMDKFPEIYKRRPSDANMKGYWFPTEDTDSRKRVLMEAISEIKQDL